MSQWTHVNSIFRLDSFQRIKDEEIINIFGKAVDYEHMDEIEYDEDWEVKDKEKYLPMGSEGTLEMSIWHNPNVSCMASTTVSVFGDLRDYESFEEIEKWFNRCCDAFAIRQAICQVNVESRGTQVFQREW
jgi:hypothetical protein